MGNDDATAYKDILASTRDCNHISLHGSGSPGTESVTNCSRLLCRSHFVTAVWKNKVGVIVGCPQTFCCVASGKLLDFRDTFFVFTQTCYFMRKNLYQNSDFLRRFRGAKCQCQLNWL